MSWKIGSQAAETSWCSEVKADALMTRASSAQCSSRLDCRPFAAMQCNRHPLKQAYGEGSWFFLTSPKLSRWDLPKRPDVGVVDWNCAV